MHCSAGVCAAGEVDAARPRRLGRRLLIPLSRSQIPGLTERWYVKTDGYTVIETQPNPISALASPRPVQALADLPRARAVLDVGQAVSMALGVIANLGLIMRFLERRPYAGTWVAIVALTIHGWSA